MTAPLKILRELGRGGAGVVYLAETPGGVMIALKRPHFDEADGAGLKETLEREIAICARLKHPNIVQVYGVGTDDAGLYLSLEWVDGCSLARLHARAMDDNELLPLETVVHVARALARALLAAHGYTEGRIRGIVHRDVSLDNLLVGANGEVKLSDFGIAHAIGTTRSTAQGSVKGKLSYLAPEMLDGVEPSPHSDIFSAGAVLYRLLSGGPPFRGRNDGELLRAIASGAAAPLAPLAPAAPRALTEWIDGALKPDPATRPGLAKLLDVLDGLGIADDAGAAQLREMLSEIVPTTPGASMHTTPVWKPPGEQTLENEPAKVIAPRRRGLPVAVVVAGLLAAAAAGAALTTLRGAPPEPRVEPPPVVAAAPVETPVEAPPPEPAVEPPPAETPKPAPAAGAKPKHGMLWVRASPWGEVFVDGTRVGQTPMSPIKLSPGTHSVIVSNPELKDRRVQEVRVSPGRTTELKIRFEK